MRQIFVNGTMLVAGNLVEGQALLVEDSRIIAIMDADQAPSDGEIYDLQGGILLPGFVDVQVNGGGGVLFNDAPTVETLATIAQAHSQFGTTALLPTLITDDLDIVRAGIAAVDAAIAAGVPGIAGIHLEGPFISKDRPGIHDPAKIIALDDAGIAAITGLKWGRTLITLAPENISALQLSRLVGSDCVIAAGHSNASYAELMAAIDHGVRGVTHLFNAMSQLTAREPGAVGAALEHPDCWCCIIADGAHVHPASLKLALRAKGGVDRFILVSDAMATVGSDQKSFVLNGETIRVVDGVCQADDGTLAGSDLDMSQAWRNAIDHLDVPLALASQMASENPARFIGIADHSGRLEPGLAADMVLLDSDRNVIRTWVGGALIWPGA